MVLPWSDEAWHRYLDQNSLKVLFPWMVLFRRCILHIILAGGASSNRRFFLWRFCRFDKNFLNFSLDILSEVLPQHLGESIHFTNLHTSVHEANSLLKFKQLLIR